jgi:hypothetical protein
MTDRKRSSHASLIWRPAPLALEPRLIFDGAFVPTLDGIDDEPTNPVDPRRDTRSADEGKPKQETRTPRLRSSPLEVETATEPTDQSVSTEAAGERVLVVSGYLPNLPELQSALGDVARIHVLEGSGDALAEIDAILSDYDQVSELHVVTHGRAGALVVGDEVIDRERLAERTAALSGWTDAMRSGADLLLYGCDIGAEQTGRVFVDSLSTLTGADIAASDDTTAAPADGGDSELEVEVGKVSAAPLLTADILDELAWQLDSNHPKVDSVSVEVASNSVKVTLSTGEAS